MKQITLILFSGILLLSACGQSPSETQTTPIPVVEQATSTPFPLPSPTQTSIPSETPIASITPLPTIPTFTPTFDVRTIVTVTPAQKAECLMKGKPTQVVFETFPSGQKYVDHLTIDEILTFLNSDGQLEQIDSELKQIDSQYEIKDITNDEIPDLIIVSGTDFQTINILWCQNGKYNLFPKDILEGETLGSDQVIFSLQDLNHNGLSEVLSIGNGRTGLNINIIEWDHNGFVDLTSSGTRLNASMTGPTSDGFELADLDNNGIPEIILKGIPDNWYYPGEPLRTQIGIYEWDGETFSPSTAFSSPQYRFQAIQDGDILTIQGSYNEATKLYQNAINSDVLDWWSKERFVSKKDATINSTTSPTLVPDMSEYPRLAAYAYYRIMLIHLVQNQESEAATTYNTLQQKFGNNPYARPYMAMASTFWETYQSTHKMYDGCAAAIQYAVEHPEILTPLGSDYHGSQSHIYVPADVCPFR